MYAATSTTIATTTVDRSSSWARIVLRWTPTFLGFPAAGFVAEVVGRVDSPAPAILGGAITGAILGVVQWLGMRRTGPSPVAWVAATTIGFTVGLGFGAAAAGYGTDVAALATQGAICGAAVGVAQAVTLSRKLGPVVLAWPLALAGLWSLGWTITSSAGIDVEAQYTVFGSSGALVVTAGTSVVAIALARAQQRGAS